MIRDLAEVYRRSGRFVRLCPGLVAIPIIAECVQHIAEFRIGMYDSLAGAKAADADPLRLALGFVKTIAILWLGYGVSRFLGFGDDPARARAIEPRALRLYGGVLLWEGAWIIVQLWGGALPRAFGFGERDMLWFGVAVFAILAVIEIYLSAWKVAAALGNGAIGFLRSFGVIHGHFWWSLGFTLLALLPPMIVHYALGLAAIGRPLWLAYALVGLDTLFVGYLSTALIAIGFVIARRATAAKGIALLPA
jgi:hypothetical protein